MHRSEWPLATVLTCCYGIRAASSCKGIDNIPWLKKKTSPHVAFSPYPSLGGRSHTCLRPHLLLFSTDQGAVAPGGLQSQSSPYKPALSVAFPPSRTCSRGRPCHRCSRGQPGVDGTPRLLWGMVLVHSCSPHQAGH